MKIIKNETCCFTGHRPQKLSWGYNEQDERCKQLKRILKSQIEQMITNGIRTFISGMALGTDIWAAEIVLELKSSYPNVRLVAAIPHEGQQIRWSDEYKKRYSDIRNAADDEVVLHEHYTKSCMHERNRWMVDRSACLIAVFNGEKGGTKGTIEYAQRKGLNVVLINPVDFSVKN